MVCSCKPIEYVRFWSSGLIVVLFGILLASCGNRQPTKQVLPEKIVSQPDTTLGSGDVFDVRVYGEKDLSGAFRVASDGTIDFPLLGTVQVNGLTPTEIVRVVEDGLKAGEFLKKPQVSIFVKEYTSKKISVFGQVKKPGTFSYHDGMSVVEAISIAGGFTSMAKENDTTVIRVVDEAKKRFRVPVKEIGQGKAANFFLRSGDIVFVPERIF